MRRISAKEINLACDEFFRRRRLPVGQERLEELKEQGRRKSAAKRRKRGLGREAENPDQQEDLE